MLKTAKNKIIKFLGGFTNEEVSPLKINEETIKNENLENDSEKETKREHLMFKSPCAVFV